VRSKGFKWLGGWFVLGGVLGGVKIKLSHNLFYTQGGKESTLWGRWVALIYGV